MKTKPILAILAIAAAVVPHAEALYHDAVFQTGVTYTFRIADGLSGTQVALLSISRGRLELEDSRVVAPGSSLDVPFTVPNHATRVILALDLRCTPTSCGDATLTVLDQANNPVAPSITTHGDHFEVGFDVAP